MKKLSQMPYVDKLNIREHIGMANDKTVIKMLSKYPEIKHLLNGLKEHKKMRETCIALKVKFNQLGFNVLDSYENISDQQRKILNILLHS